MFFDYLNAFLLYLMPKRLLTWLTGLIANSQIIWVKNFIIKSFIDYYQVDMSEAIDSNFNYYRSFNEFFIRQLRPELRPIANTTIVSPVDGSISAFGHISQGQLIQAKGKYYTVNQLLACDDGLVAPFTQGEFITCYLAPKNYHRIHMPVDGVVRKMIYVPGALFSVKPSTARTIPCLFARNERVVIFFDTPLGAMAMVLVGATLVGRIATHWHGEFDRVDSLQVFDYDVTGKTAHYLHQGEELGYFKLGSTVILLFAQNEKIAWLDTLAATQTICYGQALA